MTDCVLFETPVGDGYVYDCRRCGAHLRFAVRKPNLRMRCVPSNIQAPTPSINALSTTTVVNQPCGFAGRVYKTLPCSIQGGNRILHCNHFDELVSLRPLSGAAIAFIGERSTTGVPKRTCHGCKTRTSKQPCDVLVVMGKHWLHRRDRFVSAIRGMGISVESSDAKTAVNVRYEIERHTPKVVFAHTYHVPAVEIEKVSGQFPDIRFVTVCHSSLNHLFGKSAAEHQRSLALCQRLPNVWYATPEMIEPAYRRLGYERYVRFPNPMVVPTTEPAFVERDPDTVMLVGRGDIVKAFPVAALAAGILAKERGVRVMVATKGKGRAAIEPFLRSAGVSAEWLPWKTCEEFAATMRRRVSVVLQPSLTESFNYVALESILEGVPVVGSPTIRFLPPSWQADPNDPESIVRAADEILDNRRQAAELAYTVGRRVAHDQNAALEKLIRKLMDGGQ